MYTGGVSSLAEQIANQLQRKDQPKTLLDKKELVRDIPGALSLAMAPRQTALACSEGLMLSVATGLPPGRFLEVVSLLKTEFLGLW